MNTFNLTNIINHILHIYHNKKNKKTHTSNKKLEGENNLEKIDFARLEVIKILNINKKKFS